MFDLQIQFAKYFEDYSQFRSGFSNAITDAVQTIAEGLLITPEEYANCTSFIVDKFYKVPNKERLLVISDDQHFQFTEIKHSQRDGLSGQIYVLRILRADTYLFQYAGKERLELNGKYIFPRHVYFMPRGNSIKGEGMSPIYYSDVISGYLKDTTGDQVDFLARNIEFHFKNSPNGIHNFSFQGKSGQMVGIMGGSGTGKSTLVKVLNGSLKHDAGSIYSPGPLTRKFDQRNYRDNRLRYYEGSDSCHSSPSMTGLPTYCALPSCRSTSNHVMRPVIALTTTSA